VLRSLRLRNFKAWRDTGTLELAPLTLFFGSNSSGKSSINHFLMMLSQTMHSPDRNSVFDFGEQTAAVQLGSFRDAIFRHDIEREIDFTTEWQLPAPLTVRDPRSRRRFASDRLTFSARARQAPRSRTVQSEGFTYELGPPNDKQGLTVTMKRAPKRPNRWELDAKNYDLIRARGRAWELPKPVQFYGFPAEASVYYQNTVFLGDLELALEDRLDSITYLGPLREPPDRLYIWPGNVPIEVGWRGENTVQAILAASGRELNWRTRGRLQPFQATIASRLESMGLVDSFSVREIAPDRNEYEVLVKASGHQEEVKLTDVGFGVSQALPVVVQCFYAAPHSTVLIEQPELHLHPAVQSSLANVFVDAIKARENGAERGVQLIVESHSDHLLRRLQRLIAEGRVPASDVAIYFCYSGKEGSDIDRLELDSYGDIANWPPDFFGDELEDVLVQAELGMQKRLNLRE
jgi:hypothetical protein